jgi:hypothetical protein
MHENSPATGFRAAGDAQQGQENDDTNHVLGLRECGSHDSITAINFADRVKVGSQASHGARAAVKWWTRLPLGFYFDSGWSR